MEGSAKGAAKARHMALCNARMPVAPPPLHTHTHHTHPTRPTHPHELVARKRVGRHKAQQLQPVSQSVRQAADRVRKEQGGRDASWGL